MQFIFGELVKTADSKISKEGGRKIIKRKKEVDKAKKLKLGRCFDEKSTCYIGEKN